MRSNVTSYSTRGYRPGHAKTPVDNLLLVLLGLLLPCRIFHGLCYTNSTGPGLPT